MISPGGEQGIVLRNAGNFWARTGNSVLAVLPRRLGDAKSMSTSILPIPVACGCRATVRIHRAWWRERLPSRPGGSRVFPELARDRDRVDTSRLSTMRARHRRDAPRGFGRPGP